MRTAVRDTPVPPAERVPAAFGASGADNQPPVGQQSGPSVRRRPREFTSTDVIALAGSAISAFCLNWLIFQRLLSDIDGFGFVVCTYAVFLVIFTLVSTDRLGWLVGKDRLATVVVFSGAVVVLVPLVFLVGYIIIEGLKALRPSFFVEDQAGITPIMPATAGGGAHAIVGTVEQVGLALVWSLPLGIAAAVILNESRSRWRRPSGSSWTR
jgi:phosphate transport system permease protein